MAFKVILVILTIAFLVWPIVSPTAYPQKWHVWICTAVFAIVVPTQIFAIPIYPVAAPIPLGTLAVALGLLAVGSPVAGLLAHAIFERNRTGIDPFRPDRFGLHLITNVLGAGVAVGFVFLGRTATLGSPERFSTDWVFNIFLAMSTVIVLNYVRSQQLRAHADMAKVGPKEEPSEGLYYEYSLRRLHQSLNATHLIAVTFTFSTTLLYVLADAMTRARAGDPASLSGAAVIVVVLALVFLLICGLPRRDKDEGLQVVFLTGTPAALCVLIMWFALYDSTTFRNASAFLIVVVSYAIYVAFVVLQLRIDKKSVQLHNFISLVIFLVLSALLAAMFAS